MNPPKSAITKFTFHNLVLYLTNYYFPQLSPNTGKQYPENSSLHQKFIDQKLGLVSAKYETTRNHQHRETEHRPISSVSNSNFPISPIHSTFHRHITKVASKLDVKVRGPGPKLAPHWQIKCALVSANLPARTLQLLWTGCTEAKTL